MECISVTSLHRKSGHRGTQPLLMVKQSKKVTPSERSSVGDRKTAEQLSQPLPASRKDRAKLAWKPDTFCNNRRGRMRRFPACLYR
jgi:hypothetical protein